MKVLVIEDDAGIGKLVRRGLEEAAYQVDVALDGATGLNMALENTYVAIVLDVMLPKLDGWRVCEDLRSHRSRTPILMLTARDPRWADDRVESSRIRTTGIIGSQ